jgi:hypothetical protein
MGGGRIMGTGTTVLVMIIVIGLVLLILSGIAISTVIQVKGKGKAIRTPCDPHELVLSIEQGIPWLLNRPLNAPVVKVRVYDLNACSGTWVKERGVSGEDDHGKYIEVCWGKEML